MKNIFKNKIVTIVILIATLVLAGIAVFTAIRLYQLRQEAVAPNVPTSEPAAAIPSGETPNNCDLPAFTIVLSSPSASPSTSPSTPPVSCNNTCSADSDCDTGLVCSAGKCRNTSCTTETDCTCATPTPTPSSTPAGSATPTPSPLPDAGVSYPTILGAGLGILVILGAILLII